MPPKRPAPPPVEEPKFSITDFLTEHRKTLVAVAVILALATLGTILYVIQQKQARSDSWASLMGTLGADNHRTDLALAVLGPKLVVGQDQEKLESLLEDADSDLVPHVLLRLAISRGMNEDYEKAIEALDRLENEFGDHPILAIPSPDRSESLVRATRNWIESELRWKKAHDLTPPEVNTDRVALVETDKGSFWVGFYPEQASRHVEGFVERALAGGFNGISVISIQRDSVRFGGDASKDDDPKNDEDKEVEGLLPSDKGRYRIPQTKGALSAVASEGGESPARFDVVIVEKALGLDKKQTVFGRVLTGEAPEFAVPGFAALEAIGRATTYRSSEDEAIRGNTEYSEILSHPVKTIRVHRISIWSGGKLVEGHDWDTSTVVHPKDAPPIPVEDEKAAGTTDPEKEESGTADPEKEESGATDPEKEESGTDEPKESEPGGDEDK